MGDTLHCPNCDAAIESTDDLETDEGVPELEPSDDGTFELYANRDLFLCTGCKKPLGVGRSRRSQ